MKQSEAFLARPMLILTVALVGLNLRPFMTSIGPLVSKIRLGTGLSLQGIALLTLLPMMLMGLIAFIGPIVQSMVGERRVVLGALLTICIGCALRFLFPTAEGLIASAIIIGLGVALIQAAFPGIIKREFSQHIGPMMGLYSAMLMGGGIRRMVGTCDFQYNGSMVTGAGFLYYTRCISIIINIYFFTLHCKFDCPSVTCKNIIKET